MTIVTADSPTSPSRFAELGSISSGQFPANDPVASLGKSTPSLFELMFSQQIDAQLSASSSDQASSDGSNGLSGTNHKTSGLSSHSTATLPTTQTDLSVTSSVGNSMMLSNGHVNASLPAVAPSTSTAGQQIGQTPSKGAGTANPVGTSAVIPNGHSIDATSSAHQSESPVVDSQIPQPEKPASNSGTTTATAIAFNDFDQVMTNEMAELFSNNGFAETGTNVEIHAASETINQWFQVSEFSVESTPVRSVDNAGFGSSTVGISSDDIAPTVVSAKAASSPLRPTPRIDNSTATNSAMIPSTNAIRLANIDADSPIADQLATAVTQQLDEESKTGPTTVRIRLDRQDLGAVNLHVSINHDIVSIRIVTQDQIARQIIDSQMNDLRQSLTENGVTCGQFQVACDSSGQQFSGQKRTAQPVIALGFSTTSKWSRPETGSTASSIPEGRLNFVA